MLSSFYYMRSLDYAGMKPGDKKELTVFSGKRKEKLTITYHGLENVNIDKTEYPAYKISFSFTAEGGKKAPTTWKPGYQPHPATSPSNSRENSP